MLALFAAAQKEFKIKDTSTQLLRNSEHFRSFSPRNSEFGAKLRISEPAQALPTAIMNKKSKSLATVVLTEAQNSSTQGRKNYIKRSYIASLVVN